MFIDGDPRFKVEGVRGIKEGVEAQPVELTPQQEFWVIETEGHTKIFYRNDGNGGVGQTNFFTEHIWVQNGRKDLKAGNLSSEEAAKVAAEIEPVVTLAPNHLSREGIFRIEINPFQPDQFQIHMRQVVEVSPKGSRRIALAFSP